MMFSTAIFDLDGTLLNSMDVWEKIDIKFLTKRGISVPKDYVVKICSLSFKEAAQYTIDLFHLDECSDDIIAEWNAMADYEYANNVRLVPFALDYIMKLKDRNIQLAIATGLPEGLYKPCLINNGIYDLFDVICSTDEVKRGKEYPDVFIRVSEILSVNPNDCIVFDDVLPAIKSAKQADMLVCGVFDKYSAHHQSQIKNIADGYIYSFENAPLPEIENVELWDLYDANRNITGLYHKRSEPIPQGYYHLVVSVWIENSNGEYLLSQRHPNKPYPLYWECTGGSALAGEDSLQAALREVNEELGVDLNEYKGGLIYQAQREQTQDFYDVWLFRCDIDITELKLQSTEVVNAKWATKAELEKIYNNHELHPLLDYYKRALS